MKSRSRQLLSHTLLAALLLFGVALAPASQAASVEEERADVQKMASETLERLYKVQPSARNAISRSAGYAVFSAFGTKILIAGGGSGSGVAYDNRTRKAVYMKMVEGQAGLGMGIKKYRLVWVFEKASDLNTFINSGWEVGAQASAAAKTGTTGASYSGALSIRPGVWLYQLTDDGLALELTAKGTKYYKDDKLN
jgi:lipid-binding SYLF domain-containing protein